MQTALVSRPLSVFRMPAELVRILEAPRRSGLVDAGFPLGGTRSDALRWIIESWCHEHGVKVPPPPQCEGQLAMLGED